MRTWKLFSGLALLLSATTMAIHAEIIAGPITNPANGHDYYLLSPNSWSASETEAENLWGTLTTIRNADEQKWVFETFAGYGGTNRDLWIGLHRKGRDRSLIWATGERPTYMNWAGGQPDDDHRIEGAVFMASVYRPWGFPMGSWGDVNEHQPVEGVLPNGVVEVEGKAEEKMLTEKEKALVGTWYEGGDATRPAWIAQTDNLLFLINHDKDVSRLILSREGFIYDTHHVHGEVVKDKIVWSNDTWWSQSPVTYGRDRAVSKNSNE